MNVKVINTQGQAALIEWREGNTLQRGVVHVETLHNPTEKAAKGETLALIDDEHIQTAMPWGLDMEPRLALAISAITPARIANAMHGNGLWTAEDVKRNYKASQAAFLIVCKEAFASFFESFKE